MTSPEETEIAVWGPTQSGKDWLYKGFARELEEYSFASRDFDFTLMEKRRVDADFLPVVADHPVANPTTQSEDFIHSFTRKPKPNRQNDNNLKTSLHTHYINFHNSSGAELVSAVMNPANSDTTVKNSPYTLIVLDPDFENSEAITSDETKEHSDIAYQPGLNKDQYFMLLTRLLGMLADAKIPDRYLAVCITKTDLLRIGNNNSWYFLERVFGQKIHRLFNNYKALFNIEVFATSAAGYLDRGGKTLPNFAQGKIINPDNWKPINCAAPFFWIFQNKEIERIKRTSNFLNRESNLRSYLRYPAPLRYF